MCGVVFAA